MDRRLTQTPTGFEQRTARRAMRLIVVLLGAAIRPKDIFEGRGPPRIFSYHRTTEDADAVTATFEGHI